MASLAAWLSGAVFWRVAGMKLCCGLERVHDKKVMSHAALGSDLRSQKS
jgi:hypothetical protein